MIINVRVYSLLENYYPTMYREPSNQPNQPRAIQHDWGKTHTRLTDIVLAGLCDRETFLQHS